jgi:hypothetical protein
MSEVESFRISQGFDVLQPKTGRAYPVPCDEWDFLKRKLREASPAPWVFRALGSLFLGAALTTFITILSGAVLSIPQPYSVVIRWAVVAVSAICGFVFLYSAGQQDKLHQTQVSDAITQMELIERRYPAPDGLLLVSAAVGGSSLLASAGGQMSATKDPWTHWEVFGGSPENWTVGIDFAEGSAEGHILRKEPLARNCSFEFDAVLLGARGSDEIDVIVSSVMVLYYGAGVRVDEMTEILQERRRGNPVAIAGPRIGQRYHFGIEKRGDECSLAIDGRVVVNFDCSRGQNFALRDRFGFYHWRNQVRFERVRLATG